MKQNRFGTFVETTLGTVVSYLVALWTQSLIYPLFGIHIGLAANAKVAGIFAFISLVRSYIWRRLCNFITELWKGFHA